MSTEAEQTTTMQAHLEPAVLDGHRVLVGDLVLDLAMRTIHGRSRRTTISLSGNEFAILATLVKSTGRFVSKEDLLVAVAGRTDVAHPTVVDTYIKYLRDRLQEAWSSATIEKATGIGYRLCP